MARFWHVSWHVSGTFHGTFHGTFQARFKKFQKVSWHVSWHVSGTFHGTFHGTFQARFKKFQKVSIKKFQKVSKGFKKFQIVSKGFKRFQKVSKSLDNEFFCTDHGTYRPNACDHELCFSMKYRILFIFWYFLRYPLKNTFLKKKNMNEKCFRETPVVFEQMMREAGNSLFRGRG